MTHPFVRGLWRWVAPALVLVALTVAVAWRLGGGNWVIVETPSMGTTAPVGSLLWVRHVDIGSLQPGDFITFRPPGQSEAYSHLVRSVGPDGVTTGGVISGTDPWTLDQSHLMGEVVTTWFGIGWLVKAVPILMIGALLVGAAVWFLRRDWKAPAAIFGAGLVLTVAVLVVQPFTRAEQLSFTTRADGGAQAAWVTTGLLPMELHTTDGTQSVVMKPGEVGRIVIPHADDDGRYRAHVTPAVPWWFWAIVIGLCFLPAVFMTVRGEQTEDPPAADPQPSGP